MSFTRNIRQAQAEFWPAVQESIARHQAARAALHSGSTDAARHRARRPMFRVVFEETIWTLAKAHRLCTAEQTSVICAAKAWAKEYGDLDNPVEVDKALYRAVQELVATFDADNIDPQVLTSSSV
jgi:hypothetical protein